MMATPINQVATRALSQLEPDGDPVIVNGAPVQLGAFQPQPHRHQRAAPLPLVEIAQTKNGEECDCLTVVQRYGADAVPESCLDATDVRAEAGPLDRCSIDLQQVFGRHVERQLS